MRWRDRLYWAINLVEQHDVNYGRSGATILRWSAIVVQDFAEGFVEWIDGKFASEIELVRPAPEVPDTPVIDTLF